MAPGKAIFSLAGRVFGITGGASGIGLATASLLAQNGSKAIWIADRQTNLFDSVYTQLKAISPSVDIHLDNVDVSKSAEVDSWIDKIVTTSGALHGAANVAGVPEFAVMSDIDTPMLVEQTDEEWRRIHSVNLDGMMFCTRAQFRVMHKMPKGSNPSIVNVSSLAAVLHGGQCYAYSTSKAATEHFTRSAAKDGFRHGIRVNGVLPGKLPCFISLFVKILIQSFWLVGNTRTPMREEFFKGASDEAVKDILKKMDLMGVVEPVDVGRAIVWLLSEDSLNVNGVSLTVGEGAP
jgi:chanoclavine-I dehydrogenase